jgi:hypothetical protein
MKSAYEIAMEKLKAAGGSQKTLTDPQTKRVAEIEKKYAARIAETKLSLGQRVAAAKREDRAALQEQLVNDVKRLEEKREAEKDAVWNEA